MDTCHADRLLRAFVEGDNTGVICPRLKYLNFRGNIDFSLQTLRLFLEGKQGELATKKALLPWKRVVVSIGGIEDKEIRQQMLNLVWQKKAAGLDVDAFLKDESFRRQDSHFHS